jgi:hypothetical protein
MSRPQKAVVDYFPHSCTHGKTLFIVESKYGLIGYAIWFKLLEHLGRAESHYLNCSEYSSWAYLVAQIGTDEKTLSDLLDLLSNLGAIDSLLWSHKIIASENFITNLAFLYQKRTVETPSIESIRRINGVNDAGNPQSKVKESKVKESKEELITLPESLQTPDFQTAWDSWILYKKEAKKKLTNSTASKQLAKLEPFGPEIAIQMINRSIENGWSGIFELKGNQNAGNSSGRVQAGTWEDDGRYDNIGVTIESL